MAELRSAIFWVLCPIYIRNAANSEENLYTLGRIFYISLLSTGQKAGNDLPARV